MAAVTPPLPSAAPRRPPARVALQAGAVAHHGEVAALGAGFADVAFHPRFGAAIDRLRFGRRRGGRGGEGDAADRLRRLAEPALERRRALDVAALGARTANQLHG